MSLEAILFELRLKIIFHFRDYVHVFHIIVFQFFVFSKVHITKATLLQLNDRFQVEPGNGGEREPYLADHKIESYLIVPPAVSRLGRFNIQLCTGIGVGYH